MHRTSLRAGNAFGHQLGLSALPWPTFWQIPLKLLLLSTHNMQQCKWHIWWRSAKKWMCYTCGQHVTGISVIVHSRCTSRACNWTLGSPKVKCPSKHESTSFMEHLVLKRIWTSSRHSCLGNGERPAHFWKREHVRTLQALGGEFGLYNFLFNPPGPAVWV